MLVIGLDGVPFTLVKKFCTDGTWRFMEGLAKSGALRQMEVTHAGDQRGKLAELS